MPVQTVWRDNLRRLLEDWSEETGNTQQPVAAVLDFLYESLAEQGRSQHLGQGLLLATAHSAKGLEFDHVFILGDNWQVPPPQLEEERRLYYVAMTRARETLHLLHLESAPNPHIASLHGEFALRRRPDLAPAAIASQRTYHLLGMEDLYLDFAGRKPEHHPTRQALRALHAGCRVGIKGHGEQVDLVNEQGVALARLSKKAQAIWAPRVASIKEARVVALVRRRRDELADTKLQASCHGQSWQVPLVELACDTARA